MRKYAIIGKGFIYDRHVQAIKDTGGQVIVDCDIEKPSDFYDYRNMLSSSIIKEIDAIIICTPNHLHAEMIRACLPTGKPVLCEKPLTINTDFTFMDNVNIVLQLRYHPLFNEICSAMRKAKNIKLVLKAYRDANFWGSWKGDEQKSGGVIYIMGAHVFDLLTYALGNKYEIINCFDSMKKSYGTILFNKIIVNFDIAFLDSREGQTRHIKIDGKKFVLSLKDNLSFEGLHDKVYQAFKIGAAPKLNDVRTGIELIDSIKKQ